MQRTAREMPREQALHDHTKLGEQHQVSMGYRWLAWVGTGVLVLALLACYGVPTLLHGSFTRLYISFAGTLVLAPLCVASLASALRLQDRFIVGDRGLIRTRAGGGATVLAWEDVSSMRDRPLLNRVEITDCDGRRTKLDYRLTDFERLAESVAVRIAETGAVPGEIEGSTTEITTFHRGGSWLLPAPTLALGVVGGSLLVFGGILIVAWVLAFGLWLSWLSGWRRVVIADGSVLVKYLFRTRRIAGPEIAGVAMEVERNGLHRRAVVIVHLPRRRRLRLAGSREGDLALYGAIERISRRTSGEGLQ